MRDIPPDIGVKFFDTQKEAVDFLHRYGFKFLYDRDDYDVYKTTDSPQKTAIIHETEEGLWRVAQSTEE